MHPYPAHAPAPTLPGRTFITLGAVGGGVLALAALAPFVAPGPLPLGATLLGEILLILGLFGLLQRSGSALWLLAALGVGLNLLGTLMGLARLTIGMGLLGGIAWLFAAAAWGMLGLTLLVRRGDGHPGVGSGAGILALLRAASSFVLGVLPFFGFLGLDPTLGLRSWQISAFFSSALVALFCATAITKPAGRPATPGWQPPPPPWSPGGGR